jgi:predicted nucleic acid-binding protein
VVVADASTLVSLLLGHETREWVLGVLAGQRLLHAPALIDYEVASALRTVQDPARALTALDDLDALPLERHDARPLLAQISELRRRMSAYDASYVVLAEILDLPLVTLDRRLARAAGGMVSVVSP